MTREKGWSAITARDLANRLHCSTQPLFRTFQNMNELKEKVYQRALEEYNSYMLLGLQNQDAFKEMGLAYIRFAKNEKHLFQLLFMADVFQGNRLTEIVENDQDDEEIINLISSMSGLSKASSKQAYLNIWLTTHGIASMIATNSCNYSEEEIRSILDVSYHGTISYLKQKEDSNEKRK